ncbi:hypothetical protein THRCLA_08061 [Thraustotheca clavata]|uniref:Uncharacterized protein n=1 Tax=Thraustotheca clavata TaxID=74557 RepID=A0A1V9ZAM4_9STRA|nr:hypothetical protein THRCLA_08061 [Thraustotheca clavata]
MKEEHHDEETLLNEERMKKPRFNSGDRACMFVFMIVGLSIMMMGPTVVWNQERINKKITFVDLRWFMWTEERTDMLRQHLNIESLSMLQEIPGSDTTYVLHQTKWMDVGNLSFSTSQEGIEYQVYLSNEYNMQYLGSFQSNTSTFQVKKNQNWTSIHLLQRNSKPASGKFISATWNGQEFKSWTVFPGLLGEQLQLFSPMWMNSVQWQPLVSSYIPPLTWMYCIVHTSFTSKANLHFHAPGLTQGTIYWNGQRLGSLDVTKVI